MIVVLSMIVKDRSVVLVVVKLQLCLKYVSFAYFSAGVCHKREGSLETRGHDSVNRSGWYMIHVLNNENTQEGTINRGKIIIYGTMCQYR